MGDKWAIDVSRWQGVIDWYAVARAGVQGAWIKVGGADGGLYSDSKGAVNISGAEAAGLPYGTYYFAHPAVNDARRQAEHAVSVGQGKGVLWPVLDLETNPHGMSAEQLDQFAMQFCDRIRELTGRETLLYTGAYTGVGHCSTEHPDCPLWIASYGNNSPGTQPPGFDPKVPLAWQDDGWSAWQFNSVTYIPGIPSNSVDQNTVREGFWNQMLRGEGLAPPDEEEEDMALTGLVRTKIGSEWALAAFGDNSVSHYLLTIEGSRKVRRLDEESLSVELFFKGQDVSSVWEVEDNFFTGNRYLLEPTNNLSGIVRTKIGSAWAEEHFHDNSISHYILTIEGARRCRRLTQESLQTELWWRGQGVASVWEVDDNFFTDGRYMLEPASDTLKIRLHERDGDLIEIEVDDND